MSALPADDRSEEDDARIWAERWLEEFNARLVRGEAGEIARMFRPDGTWRDMLVLDWHVESIAAADLFDVLTRRLPLAGLAGIQLDPERTEPMWTKRAGVDCVELFFRFTHAHGNGQGLARIVPDGHGRVETWHLLTVLDQLAGAEERAGAARPKRAKSISTPSTDLAERQPEVVIIGAGQAGLSVAARLARMGVDALVLERNAEVGGNWRSRYASLALHNAIWINHLPYLPFPESWPTYLPKDLIADWLAFYAQAMDLDVRTGCAAQACAFSEREGRWSISVKHGEDDPVTIRCRHLVMATGVSGKPKIPDLPGLADFRGTVIHSSDYRDGAAYRGQKALVFGTGSSGHDIAQDLHEAGAEVTLVQRGSMTVCSIEPSAAEVLDALFTERAADEADMIAASVPYADKVRVCQAQTARVRELDADLHAGLERIGFKLDFGEDGTGASMKYLRQGGGFYLNVGCSDLLIGGAVRLVQAGAIERFVSDGVRLVGGEGVEADLAVMATGFEAQSAVIRQLFGDAVAAQIGPVWGMDDKGEQRNVWRRTSQKGLWFMFGNFQQCRFYSKILALQICADLRALMN